MTASDSLHVRYIDLSMWEEFFPSTCFRKSSTILCADQETSGGSPGQIERDFRTEETEGCPQRFRFNIDY